MKNVIIFSLIILTPWKLFSQSKLVDESSLVYNCLVTQLNIKSAVPIYYRTSLSILNKADIYNQKFKRWSKMDTVVDWKPFFKHININSINESDLQGKSLTHPLVKTAFFQDQNTGSFHVVNLVNHL